ncbi:MAG: type III pantothenate kinase [Desulfurivibrio sp.]
MLLAIDVGNSHTVIGLFDGARLRCRWRLGTDRGITVDELAVRLHVLFAMDNATLGQISGVIIASVVPPMASTWSAFTRKYLGLEVEINPVVVDNRLDSGIRVATDQPAEVGADRLVNAAAAYRDYQCALIIVDFGTAITLDCVSAAGEYLGGTITPGVAISLDALNQRTAKLPRVDIATPPRRPIGSNTVEAIRSGILYGYAGMIEGLVRRIREQMAPEKPKVIATGGMAELIAPYAPVIEEVDPLLTLKGLQLIYERNH